MFDFLNRHTTQSLSLFSAQHRSASFLSSPFTVAETYQKGISMGKVLRISHTVAHHIEQQTSLKIVPTSYPQHPPHKSPQKCVEFWNSHAHELRNAVINTSSAFVRETQSYTGIAFSYLAA
jgi:hypothetical protein